MNRYILLLLCGSAMIVVSLISRTVYPLFLLLPLLMRFYRDDRGDEADFEVIRTIDEKRLPRLGETEVSVKVTNRGPDQDRVLIRETPPPALTILEGQTARFTSLKKGESIELKYRIRCDRGRHRFPPLSISLWNHFGLDKREIRIENDDEIIALPDPAHLSSLPINVRKTLVFAGMNPSGQGGDGVYFHDVREYRPGDSLRHIHWPAVAKHPEKLITREFEQERVSDIGIILDAREESYMQMGENRDIERAIEAVSALSHILLSLQNRVGLMVYGKYLNWTQPGYGKMQEERIRRALAVTETGSHHVFKSLQNLPTNLFPERSQLIFISPILPEDAAFLRRLRGRGYMIILFCLDNLTRTEGKDPLTLDLINLERSQMIRELERCGITVIRWNLEEGIENLIQMNKGKLRMAVRGKM